MTALSRQAITQYSIFSKLLSAIDKQKGYEFAQSFGLADEAYDREVLPAYEEARTVFDHEVLEDVYNMARFELSRYALRWAIQEIHDAVVENENLHGDYIKIASFLTRMGEESEKYASNR